jgi:lysophospholipase L1-like esterase
MDNANDTVVICAGDSILNNTIYVPPGKSVVDYIRLNSDKDIINISRDGAIITDVYNQMRQIPNVETTNMTIILSVGGNDLLEYELIEKAYINYIELIKYIKQTYKCKLYVLNLYYPIDESMKTYHETISKWNTLLNEIPKKEKIEINIIDISKIITEPSDLVNKIEPSVTGGLKIANKIIKMVNI